LQGIFLESSGKNGNDRGGGYMDERVRRALFEQVAREEFSRKLSLRLVDLDEGFSRVEMTYTPDMENIFGMAHGGAIFSLIDEAFETACNSHGTIAVALNVTVTYMMPPEPGSTLTAEARELSRSRKTASYDIKVHDHEGRLIASCQALAYRKGSPLPFLEEK
jgi:acyl-CoA thioesterase